MQLELLEGINGRNDADPLKQAVVHRDTIDHEADGSRSRTIDTARPKIVVQAMFADARDDASLHLTHTGIQKEQIGEVAAVERQLGQLPAADHLPQSCRVSLHLGCDRGYLHRLRRGPDFEADVDA